MKVLNILCCCLLMLACKQKEVVNNDLPDEAVANKEISQSEIAKIEYTQYVLSPEARVIVQDWNEYTQLQEQVNYVKKGDLNYFKDNRQAIEALFKGLYNNIPEGINENSILSRIKIVETTFYDLESKVTLETTTQAELYDGVKAFLIAVNNLDLQMNKIIELENQNIAKP